MSAPSWPMSPPVGVLADRLALAALVEAVPAELVDQVIAEAGVDDGRGRLMPAELAVYYSLARWLWAEDDCEVVLERLWDALAWLRLSDLGDAASWRAQVPPVVAASDALRDLGSDPLVGLFHAMAGLGDSPGEGFFGLAVRSLDACPVRVSGRCGFSLARVLTLADARGSVHGAAWAPGSVAMGELAGRLFRPLTTEQVAGSVIFAGQAFAELWPLAFEHGAHVVAELPPPAVVAGGAELGDGSFLTELHGVRVRIVSHTSGRLATTLTDPTLAPAHPLVWRHGYRWRATTMLSRAVGHTAVTLRSRTADGVDQEIWALLVLYQALARPVADPPPVPAAAWVGAGQL